jgi:hypothetical protein
VKSSPDACASAKYCHAGRLLVVPMTIIASASPEATKSARKLPGLS